MTFERDDFWLSLRLRCNSDKLEARCGMWDALNITGLCSMILQGSIVVKLFIFHSSEDWMAKTHVDKSLVLNICPARSPSGGQGWRGGRTSAPPVILSSYVVSSFQFTQTFLFPPPPPLTLQSYRGLLVVKSVFLQPGISTGQHSVRTPHSLCLPCNSHARVRACCLHYHSRNDPD